MQGQCYQILLLKLDLWRYRSEESRPSEAVASRRQYSGPCGWHQYYPSKIISVFLTKFHYFSYQVKGKGIPFTGHEGPREMWMQRSTYSQPRHQEEVGQLVLRSAAFTPEESPRYSFYRRLSGPQDQSGHERAKKNLHPSDTWAVQPVAQRLAT